MRLKSSWRPEPSHRCTAPSTTCTGSPIMTLRVDVPREISCAATARYVCRIPCRAAVIILVPAGAGVLNLVARHRWRALRSTRWRSAMRKDFSLARLDFRSRDEIGVLAREFDRMVGEWVRRAGNSWISPFRQASPSSPKAYSTTSATR